MGSFGVGNEGAERPRHSFGALIRGCALPPIRKPPKVGASAFAGYLTLAESWPSSGSMACAYLRPSSL